MDAAVAALVGAGIGMTGTLFAPLVNAALSQQVRSPMSASPDAACLNRLHVVRRLRS